ncbi:MAG: LysE family translocator [Oligoflexales bacterium]
MSLVIAVLSGFCGGFCSSAPLGPINLMLAEMIFQKRKRNRILTFLLGVVVTDLLYATAAAWGYAEIFQKSPYLYEIQITCGFFLIALGVFSLISLRKGAAQPKTTQDHHIGTPLKDFSTGAFLCGSNPSFVMFWLFAINTISHFFNIQVQGSLLIFFLIGIVLGDLVWFSIMARLAQHGEGSFSEKTLMKIRLGIAISFIAIGSLVMMSASSQPSGVL